MNVTQPTDSEVVGLAKNFLRANPPGSIDAVDFLGRQFDEGLAWPQFDRGVGGLGASPHSHSLVTALMEEAGAPDSRDRNSLGWGVVGPAIHQLGSRELQERHLRRLFNGLDVHCQLFSEPGAGSDLAGLSTRAVRAGPGWRVSGQKVWTSHAHRATKGALLARTDPTVPKHAGLSFFLIDMKQPGITVRPIRQLTGESNFNEVFLDDAWVADADRISDVGDGWRVTTAVLAYERAYNAHRGGTGRTPNGLTELAWAVAGRRAAGELTEAESMRVAASWVELEAFRLWRNRRHGSVNEPVREDGAVGKVLWAEANQHAFDLAWELLSTPTYPANVPGAHSFVAGYLRSQAFSIEGGTSEVQRNMIGERVLGLPIEPRVDKDVPWKEVPR